MQATPTAAPAFPAAITTAVRAAAKEFFTSSCKVEAAERPAPPDGEPCPAVMAVMSFFGDPVWSFALILPESVAVAATNGFAGFDIPFDSPDMGDMVGEMANVISGDVVARLEKVRVKAQMSLPTVARGNDVELLSATNTHELRLDFGSPAGGFQIRLFQALVSAPGG
jgi:hypothetical protein